MTAASAHKPPEDLLCQHCQQIITTTGRVIQNKASFFNQYFLLKPLMETKWFVPMFVQENIYFTCSLTCAHEFKRVNNIVGMCEFCKHERIVTYIERINNKDCFFCSDGKGRHTHTLKRFLRYNVQNVRILISPDRLQEDLLS